MTTVKDSRVSELHSFLTSSFFLIVLLGWRLCLRASWNKAPSENVIRPAVCPPHCLSDENVLNVPPSRDDEVNLIPVFGAWMHLS